MSRPNRLNASRTRWSRPEVSSKVSTSTAITEAAEQPQQPSARPAIPFKSPTYPPRTHFAERPALEAQLRSVEERLTAARRKLDVMGTPTDSADVAAMNALYAGAFGPAPYPARTTCVVHALPDPKMLIEIEAVASLAK